MHYARCLFQVVFIYSKILLINQKCVNTDKIYLKFDVVDKKTTFLFKKEKRFGQQANKI